MESNCRGITAQLGDAAFGVLRELLGGHAILHGIHGFPRVVFEITQQVVELLFQLTNLGLLFFPAFGVQPRSFAFQFLLSSVQAEALAFSLAQVA